MHITFRQLHVFRAVATLGQVQLAAKQLHLSQPATSMALSELQKNLNTQLFDRTGNRLILNAQGKKLLSLACELLDRGDEINQLFSQDMESGRLIIGASTTIGNYLLPKELAIFGQENPNISIDLEIHNTTDIIDKMTTMELDLACVEGPCLHREIDAIPWREDRMVIFCAPSHPLATDTNTNSTKTRVGSTPIDERQDNNSYITREVSIQQLEQAKWILRESASGTRTLFEQNIGPHLRQCHITSELNQTEAIKNMVASGFGISWLSELCISRELELGELVELKIPARHHSRTLWLLLNKNKYRSSMVSQLLEKLQ